jgi:apolipoprotein N-acyltransferase
MVVVLCALASGAGFYFSTGLGAIWFLAWLAPIPVLWLAYGETSGWKIGLAAWSAGAIGALNLLPAYFGLLPTAALAMGIVVTGLVFALPVMGARFVAKRLTPISGVFAFAALWTALDYLASLGANGAALSPAYSQVGFPLLIQSASLFGLWAVTFVVGFFAAGAAASMATRQALPAIFAAALVLLNAGFGAWRMAEAPKSPVVRVGLAADDQLVPSGLKADEQNALAVVDTYADAARTLATQGANLIVVPEKIAVLDPAWRGAVDAEFETVAHIGHADIVAGFDDRGVERRNEARIYFASGTPPQKYFKRHMVPGLENAFMPGQSSFMLANHDAVAICKDMDFPDALRHDSVLHPTLFAVPAWDFDKDGWWHARLAIMRGVENGFAVARAANDGLLTLSDAYGRVVAERSSAEGGMVTLVGQVPRGPGRTFYGQVGDAFAWICGGLAAILLGAAAAASRKQ